MMTHAHVPEPNRRNAKRMRKAMTEPELKLWNAVRGHRPEGLAFRRQLPIDGYIVDLACPQKKLIVELDGSHHAMMLAEDAMRTGRLEALGWKVLRFWNDDVLMDVDNVCRHILQTSGIDTP